jgi:hypothetical protein
MDSKEVFLPALMLLAAFPVFAQQSATLGGSVTDASSAVVPSVSVRIVNTATGESFAGVSNESGFYAIPLIKPGNYELTAEGKGFKQYRQVGITLETGVAARIDVRLEVGNLTESVTVQAEVPLLRTESSSVGHVVENRTIINMPLINRRAAQLARLSGFMVQNGTGSNFTMAGGRGDNSMWTIDGGNAQNILLGVATLTFDPPIESLQEFNVEISNYKAELGRTGGGFVQMTTKSGTNELHGSAYEYLRNDALDARSFFSERKPVLRYNLFGASLGGPVKKDRTFWFFNYEGTRIKRQNVRILNAPTTAEVRGDFSGLAAVRDPANGNPFPNNVIPASRLDPVGAAIAAFYPVPNIAGARTRANNFRINQPVNNPGNVYVSRIDHTFSSKTRVYGRFLASHGFNAEAPVYPTPGTDPFHFRNENYYFNWSVTGLHNLTPTVIVEGRYTYDRRKFFALSGGRDLGLAEKIGLRGVNPRFFPQVSVTGLAGFGRGEHERLQLPIRGDHITNSYTTIQGNHTIKAGWEFRKSRNDDLWSGLGGGQFGFNPNATGDALAALLLGHVNNAARAEAVLIRSRANAVGGYVQTDWKVSPKFSLNLGLRWDLDWPRFEAVDNRQNSFDRAQINPVCNCPGALRWSGRDGLGKYAHNFDYNNFGPRVGFAWRATDKWVIRGGGAVVYVGQYDQASPLSVNIGFSTRGDFVSPDGGRTAAFQLRTGLPPVQAPVLEPGFGAVAIGQSPRLSIEFFEPNDRRVGYLETFNLNIQRQLPWDMIFEIGYLGTLGHKLTTPGTRSINQVAPERIGPGNAQILRPFPQYSDVRVVQPTIGNSVYHGVNFRIEKRYSDGLQFSTNYTWAKLLDDLESRNELGGNAGDNAFSNLYERRADRGLSGNHISHRVINSVVWEVPVGKGRRMGVDNAVLHHIIGGWAASFIVEARTGSPFGVIEQNPAGTYPTAVTVRSDATGPYRATPNWRQNVLGQTFFDLTTFRAPRQFTFGNLGRTVAIGSGALAADTSILKDFPIRERHRLQFRAEMLNFINRSNFGLPAQGRGAGDFGTVRGLAPGNQARIIQLGLHYKF